MSNKLSTKGCGDMVSAFVQRLWYREEVGKGESRKKKRQYCGNSPEQKSLHAAVPAVDFCSVDPSGV
jgi:hypothetical protein